MYYLHKIWLEYISAPLYTFTNTLRAFLWGVQIGRACKFYGQTKFFRIPGSRMKIGSRCRFRSSTESNHIGINRPCVISTQSKAAEIVIEDGCGFSGTVIAARESIVIGAGTICGANVTITDFDWHHVDPHERAARNVGVGALKVNIGKNVWIGMNAIILKGVSIGDNSVIAAGSVVTTSIPENSFAAGVPAKMIKQIGEHE